MDCVTTSQGAPIEFLDLFQGNLFPEALIKFDPNIISQDFINNKALGPIPATQPNTNQDIAFGGPNPLSVTGEVSCFSAFFSATPNNAMCTSTPEGGSAALFLILALIPVAFLWRRYKRSAS